MIIFCDTFYSTSLFGKWEYGDGGGHDKHILNVLMCFTNPIFTTLYWQGFEEVWKVAWMPNLLAYLKHIHESRLILSYKWKLCFSNLHSLDIVYLPTIRGVWTIFRGGSNPNILQLCINKVLKKYGKLLGCLIYWHTWSTSIIHV